MKLARLAREAWASALAQPVASIVAIVMIAGMCAAVLLTQGRTVGAQQGVVNTLDDAGTRSVVVRAEEQAGLDSSVLARLHGISSVDWSAGFGRAIDATNTAVPGSNRVAARTAYGLDLASLGIDQPGLVGGAYASPAALEQLGMDQASGSITTTDGAEYPLVDVLDVPDYLSFLEPLLVLPQATEASGAERGEALAVLVVIATDASQVSGLTSVVQSSLDVTDLQNVSIETSQQLAKLREIIDSQLAGVGQALTLVIFVLTTALVAAILTALVMMRRKDYGRRRALGASQSFITGLVIAQTGILAVLGAIIGALAAFITLGASGDPQPPVSYYLAIATLATITGLTAAVLPAIAAARRDPARELRVP